MAKVRVTQIHSQIGQSRRHRGTLRALGLGKIGKTVEHDDGPVLTQTAPVNLRDLDRFDAGSEVTPESLVEKGVLKNAKIDVKILGMGDVSKKLTVRVHAISASAREKIEAAGGTVELLRQPKVRKQRPPKRGPGSPTARVAAEPESEATEAAPAEAAPAEFEE